MWWHAWILLVWKLVVSIQVVSIRTQEVKLHKKFDHYRLSLGVNKKNICRECSLFFTQLFETIYIWTE